MTNKEAIESLIWAKKKISEITSSESIEELDLAIKSFEAVAIAIKALEKIDLIEFNIHALNKLIEEVKS